MQRRFSIDNYLGMVLFALLGTFVLDAVIILLRPRIDNCFCTVQPMGSAPCPDGGWGYCGQYPVPGVIHAYPILSIVILGISVLVAAVGILLGRTCRTTMDMYLVYTLELCPLLTLVFLGVVGCIVCAYAYVFLPS